LLSGGIGVPAGTQVVEITLLKYVRVEKYAIGGILALRTRTGGFTQGRRSDLEHLQPQPSLGSFAQGYLLLWTHAAYEWYPNIPSITTGTELRDRSL